MPTDKDDAYAQQKAWEFLDKLTNLTTEERQEARRVFSTLYHVPKSADVLDTWRKIANEQVRADVLPAAAALLTEYFRAYIESVEGRKIE